MNDVPQFPRGFILSETPIGPPPTYIAGEVLSNFYVHPWSLVEYARDDDLFVIIIGTCISVSPIAGERVSERLLSKLSVSDETFFMALGDYAGRHAIIFGDRHSTRIVNDATAMRSVFYAKPGGIVASHALLVERALGGEIVKDELPFRGGYPGNRTPYTRTRILTANTCYDLTGGTVDRFWPKTRIETKTVAESAAYVREAATIALRGIAETMPVKLALTAGLDSRVMLAVAIHSGVDFETYTYGQAADTEIDRLLAADLADLMGIQHSVVPSVPIGSDLLESVQDAHYTKHHRNAIPSLSAWINDPSTAAVTANLLEIGRSFYAPPRRRGLNPPTTAADMYALYHYSLGGGGRRMAAEYGEDLYAETATAAFQEFIDTAGSFDAGLMDPFDQFYWEHRMTAWHGANMVERDYYAEAFIPFNSRRIFESLLGVPREDRDSAAVFYDLIRSVDPRLLDLPVNPKKWPAGAVQ